MANALVLETDTLGEIAICQLDGGLTQTAYALLERSDHAFEDVSVTDRSQITGTGFDSAARTSL